MRPLDERLLRVELAGGDGDGGRPSPAPCARPPASRRPAPNVARPSPTLQVVGDVALRPVGDDLRDPELAARRPPPASPASAATASRRLEPLEARGSGSPGQSAAVVGPRNVRRRCEDIGRGSQGVRRPARAGRWRVLDGPDDVLELMDDGRRRRRAPWSATPAPPSSRRSTTSSPAIVCTSGTPRSHIGIVSREFQVPCVMGCAFADGEPADGVGGRGRLLGRRGESWLRG